MRERKYEWNRETKGTCIDATALLSAVSRLGREVKFDQTDCRADTTAKGFIWANI